MHSVNLYLYLGALVFQLAAVVFAVRMTRSSRHRAPWALMAGAMAVMTLYRALGLLASGMHPVVPIEPEWQSRMSAIFSLAVSCMLFAALLSIRRLGEHERVSADARRESESRLRSLIDNTPASIFIKDTEGRLVLVNRPFVESAGLPADQIIGRRDADIFDPATAAEFLAEDRNVIESGKPVTREHSFEYGGRHLTYVTTKFPLFDDRGAVTGVCGIATEVTEVRRAEAAARESDDRLRLALDAASMGIWEWHLESGRMYWSESVSRLFGLPEPITEATSDYFNSLIHPDDRRRMWATAIAAIDRRAPFECDFRIIQPDGTVRWMSHRGHTIYGRDGKALRLLGTMTDVTERLERERELRESRERLDAALSASNTGTFRWDIRTGRLTFDENLGRLFGLAAGVSVGSIEQAVGRIHPDDRAEFLARSARSRETGCDFSMEYRVVWPDGSVRWLEDQGKVVADEDGRPLYMTGACVDVTARKEQELALRAAHRAAEEANRTKDEFLAALSHELRTPLAPVLLSTQLLEHDSSLPDHVRTDLRNIRKSIEIETRLIDDLLDLTRVARGKLQLHAETVDVHEVIRHSVETCRDDTFVSKRLRLVEDLSAGRPHVTGDPARLGQVVWNLLKNATKFTPEEGTITVRTWNEFVDGSSSVVIEVRDTGMGIGPEALPHIFDAFEQGGPHITRRFGGLGLGLSISKALTELHHGRIAAHSHGPGKGATFTVRLPTAATAPAPAARDAAGPERRRAMGAQVAPAGPDAPRNILLVEDHDQTGKIMTRLLASFGYDVEWAQSVDSALRAAARKRFDLVVSDLGLPDGSGHDLMRSLRAQYGLKGVALSGYGMEQDLERSARSGFFRHLTKPVTIEKLDAAIREALGPGTAVTSAAASEASGN